jgi:hypothetical protein
MPTRHENGRKADPSLLLRMTPVRLPIVTQSLTGRTKVADGFDRFPSTPIPAFPHKGERSPSMMQRYAAISPSVDEFKLNDRLRGESDLGRHLRRIEWLGKIN